MILFSCGEWSACLFRRYFEGGDENNVIQKDTLILEHFLVLNKNDNLAEIWAKRREFQKSCDGEGWI